MKQTDKIKKEKSPSVKIITSLNHKRTETKKNTLKKEETIIKNISAIGHTKISTGITTGTQSSKQLNPTVTSIKTSPKASLADVRQVCESKSKKVDLAEKNR